MDEHGRSGSTAASARDALARRFLVGGFCTAALGALIVMPIALAFEGVEAVRPAALLAAFSAGLAGALGGCFARPIAAAVAGSAFGLVAFLTLNSLAAMAVQQPDVAGPPRPLMLTAAAICAVFAVIGALTSRRFEAECRAAAP